MIPPQKLNIKGVLWVLTMVIALVRVSLSEGPRTNNMRFEIDPDRKMCPDVRTRNSGDSYCARITRNHDPGRNPSPYRRDCTINVIRYIDFICYFYERIWDRESMDGIDMVVIPQTN